MKNAAVPFCRADLFGCENDEQTEPETRELRTGSGVMVFEDR